jgi:uncharacterized membrane protein
MIINQIFLCITCDYELRAAIFNEEFLLNLILLCLGFMVLGIIVAAFIFIIYKNYQKFASLNAYRHILNPAPLTSAAVILGIGLGGFIDGIIFHQVLQWHSVLSNKIAIDTLAGKSVNMFWDGIFHLFTLITVISGIVLLANVPKVKDVNPAPQFLWGGMLAGWGLFNLIEGTLNHHILKLHNVMEVSAFQEVANYVFLGSGALFMFVGFAIIFGKNYYASSAELPYNPE